MKIRPLIAILPLLISLSPACALALAGFAEQTSVFHYNDYRQVLRGHPSDLCHGETKWCLVLQKPGKGYRREENAHFEELSVPLDRRIPYVIGRRSGDNYWILYDLTQEKVLVADLNYDNAIYAWRALGFEEPRYANGRNTGEFLIETKESVFSRWSMQLQMWFFFGVFPIFIIVLPFWFASRHSKRKYRRGDGRIYRIFSLLLFLPVLAFFCIAGYSLFQLVKDNW